MTPIVQRKLLPAACLPHKMSHMSVEERKGYEITETMRQRFVDRIAEGYAGDYLTEEEFEHRLETANKASDLRQLRRLVADLPEIDPSAAGVPAARRRDSLAPEQTARPSYDIARAAPEESDAVVCIFSGSERKGGTPALHTRSVTVFGGSDFDFRGAELQPGAVYTIDCVAVFGGVDIIVPKDVNVDVRGFGIFGGFDGTTHKGDPNAPTIRVHGFALFGGVDVKRKS